MRFSIITATYNSEKYIQSCFDSIINQTYQNIEHILIDGLSSDTTLQKIKNHKHQPDIFISEKDSGIYDALNKGISKANGEIIGILHSDDFYSSEDILSEVARVFISNPEVDLVYGDLEYVSRIDHKKVIRKWKSRKFEKKLLKIGWLPPHPTIFFKKSSFNQNKIFDLNFKISADYMFILQTFSQNKFKTFYLPKVFTCMRVGGVSNNSLSNILQKTKEDFIALKKNEFSLIGAMVAIFLKNFLKLRQFF